MTTQLPFEQANPLAPLPQRRALAATGPIHPVRTPVGHEAWLVTGYAEVRQLLADVRLGRSHPDPENAARAGESVLFGGPLGNFETEAADNARMRSLLAPHFTAKRMRGFRPRVDELVTHLLDDLAAEGPPADLNAALATPLPILVICELLGVPYEDREQFRGWSTAAADVTDRERSGQGLRALFEYGKTLVARKRAEPDADDVISVLARTDGVGDDEAAMLSMALLFAGHETTVVQIGLGVLHLLADPDRWNALRDRPNLVDSAVHEILRAPNKDGAGIPRYARAEIRVGDQLIHTGDLVLLDIGAASHDPVVFAEPDQFDLTRPNAANHLAFGHGPRYCIGAPLARLELAAVLASLVPRFPSMRLAVEPDELRVRTQLLTGGLVSLPVAW